MILSDKAHGGLDEKEFQFKILNCVNYIQIPCRHKTSANRLINHILILFVELQCGCALTMLDEFF